MALINVDWSKITINSPYFRGDVTKLQMLQYENKDNTKTITTAQHIENTYNFSKCYNVTKLQHKNNDICKNTDWLELFNERAAIMEYDGGLNRFDAEVSAFNELIYRFCEVNHHDNTDFAVNALLALGLKNPYRKSEYQ